jgi:hypothetical protein
MNYETINTHHAVNLFHSMLHPDSEIRILCLQGDSNMGKSHLMTKVFPILAKREYHARIATIDLRHNKEVPEILQSACSLVGLENCKSYTAALQAWVERSHNSSRVEVNRFRAFFSFIRISNNDNQGNIFYRDHELTKAFVTDMGNLADKPLLLMFDHFDEASNNIQAWLMGRLLVDLSPLSHIRLFVAGHKLPETYGSYTAICRNCQLRHVTEIEEYIEFCQKYNTRLVDQSIRDFAEACDFVPGNFFLLVEKFLKQDRPANG